MPKKEVRKFVQQDKELVPPRIRPPRQHACLGALDEEHSFQCTPRSVPDRNDLNRVSRMRRDRLYKFFNRSALFKPDRLDDLIRFQPSVHRLFPPSLQGVIILCWRA